VAIDDFNRRAHPDAFDVGAFGRDGDDTPTVSEHIRVLVAAGLVRRTRNGNRTAYRASNPNLARLIEDARATLARWAR
jgi:DNA-binding transcriptional ArsR family regulator